MQADVFRGNVSFSHPGRPSCPAASSCPPWTVRTTSPQKPVHPRLGPLALALAACLGPPAQAQFSSSGAVNVWPGNAAVPNGAGNADLGNVGLFVGNGGLGSFAAAGGSQ